MTSPTSHPRDPLHGITLENILNQLVQKHGWNEMGRRIPVRCFRFNPTVKSSLTFLRKTPWARKRVEDWFIRELSNMPTDGLLQPPLTSSRNRQSAASTSSQCSATFTFGQTFLILPSGPIKNVTRAVPT